MSELIMVSQWGLLPDEGLALFFLSTGGLIACSLLIPLVYPGVMAFLLLVTAVSLVLARETPSPEDDCQGVRTCKWQPSAHSDHIYLTGCHKLANYWALYVLGYIFCTACHHGGVLFACRDCVKIGISPLLFASPVELKSVQPQVISDSAFFGLMGPSADLKMHDCMYEQVYLKHFSPVLWVFTSIHHLGTLISIKFVNQHPDCLWSQ